MTSRLVLSAALLAVMIPLGFAAHWIAYDALLSNVAAMLGFFLFGLAIGFLLGQRHGLVR